MKGPPYPGGKCWSTRHLTRGPDEVFWNHRPQHYQFCAAQRPDLELCKKDLLRHGFGLTLDDPTRPLLTFASGASVVQVRPLARPLAISQGGARSVPWAHRGTPHLPG